jgi:hypothetical protein
MIFRRAWNGIKRNRFFKYLATVVLVAGLYANGPELEGRLFPVLTNIRITQLARVDGDGPDPKACFAIGYKKQRYAISNHVTFLAVTPAGEKYDTRVTVGRGQNINTKDMKPFKTLEGQQVKAVGTVGTYYWCVSLPEGVEGLTLMGKINYNTWHHQWTFDQELPALTVPDNNDRDNYGPELLYSNRNDK